MNRIYYVYIMGNQRPTLYIGVTNDLVRRVYEHKQGFVEGFTKKYGLHSLLYFEEFGSIEDAILREKRIKHWNREWKLELIRKANPTLKDLYPDIIEASSSRKRGSGRIPAGACPRDRSPIKSGMTSRAGMTRARR